MDFSQYLGGLPLHPLVVHFAVVLVPLSALFLILLVLIRGWADRFGWLTLFVLALGTGAAFLARESGEDLAGDLAPLTPQLQVCTQVVDEIDRLLNALD